MVFATKRSYFMRRQMCIFYNERKAASIFVFILPKSAKLIGQ